MKKIIIGSDKSGFQLKEAVKAHLVEAGYEVTDAGSQSEENAMFYYEAAENVAPRVGGGEFEKGILICGTGMGMSIVANKHKDRMADQVPEVYMNELNKIEEFHKSFEENGMKPEEFVTYGGFRDTLTTFIAGYDDLCKLIRGYMI